MKTGLKEMKKEYKNVNIDQIEDMQDELNRRHLFLGIGKGLPRLANWSNSKLHEELEKEKYRLPLPENVHVESQIMRYLTHFEEEATLQEKELLITKKHFCNESKLYWSKNEKEYN